MSDTLLTKPAPLTAADIAATRALLQPYIIETPIHHWRNLELDERTSVILKLELFQRTGTFKIRGALSVMLQLPADVLARGVTTVSAGNHAIATAYAARVLGTTAKVVMMKSSNAARLALCREYGAEILIAPDGPSAFELAKRIEREEGRTFVHPFEGPFTAQGTATLGWEWMTQAGALDAVIVPIGGGGLCAGVASAVKLHSPDCIVYGVEAEGADTMHRSFDAGEPVGRTDVATIADSLAPPYALPYSYALCRANVDDLVKVSDQQLIDAMALLFRQLKLAAEPAGAAATAALLGPLRERVLGKRVGVLVCGSNIDIDTFAGHVRNAHQMG
jgi:threonine dehydratase